MMHADLPRVYWRMKSREFTKYLTTFIPDQDAKKQLMCLKIEKGEFENTLREARKETKDMEDRNTVSKSIIIIITIHRSTSSLSS